MGQEGGEKKEEKKKEEEGEEETETTVPTEVPTAVPTASPSLLGNTMQTWLDDINQRGKKKKNKNVQSNRRRPKKNNFRKKEKEDTILEFSATPPQINRGKNQSISHDEINMFNEEQDEIDEFNNGDGNTNRKSLGTVTNNAMRTRQARSLKLLVVPVVSYASTTSTTSTTFPTSAPFFSTTTFTSSTSRTRLHNHQESAVEWMLLREGYLTNNTAPLPGGLLCDECGLGKTITALTLISRTKENKQMCCGGTLVICPASCIEQWCREIRTLHPFEHCAMLLCMCGPRALQLPRLSKSRDRT